jgi:hypothetical protein
MEAEFPPKEGAEEPAAVYDLLNGEELWDADPECEHDVQCAPFGGGVKCTKCRGWCCY